MKKLLLLFLFCIAFVSVNAGLIDKIKDTLSDGKEDAKEKVRSELTNQLNQKCFKIPLSKYYLCPPINPDHVL